MKKIYLIAIAMALVTATVSFLFFSSLSEKSKGETVSIIVPVTRIPKDVQITKEMLTTKNVSVQAVNENTVLIFEDIVGKIAASELYTNEPVNKNRLINLGENDTSDLQYQLKEGYRAVTVSLDETQGLGGYISVGSKIDVIALINTLDENEKIQTKSEIVCQNITVIKIGAKTENSETVGAYKSITLEVTPEQAQQLVLYSKQVIHIVLRRALDDEIVTTKPFTIE